METTSQISPKASLASDVEVGPFSVIYDNVQIKSGTIIGAGVVIHENTVVGHNVRVDDQAVLGKLPMRAFRSAITRGNSGELPPAIIGDNCIIGTFAVLYKGCQIGDKVLVADLASVREEVTVGDETILGRGVTVENKCEIGQRCKVETEAYITALSSIGDDCFISPEVTFTNDNFMGRTEKRFKFHRGVTMKRGARVGGNSTILPGIIIGEEGVVSAGSVVTRDVPPREVVLGSPARIFRPVPEEEMIYKGNNE